MEKNKSKAKRTRKKKLTKTQEEKRAQLLEKILDKWVCVKQNYSDEETYIFLKHVVTKGGSFSKIEQVVLSGDPLSDGVYLITDYEIDVVFDFKTKQELIEIRPKKFDLKLGFFAEEDGSVETEEELKNHLINAKYLTENEFSLYCQNMKKPDDIEEIILSYDTFKNEDREG